MHLSKLTIKNFRQFGAGEPVFSVHFHQGVTALVGENDVGKTAVIDAIRHVLLTRDMEFMRLQVEDFHIQVDGQQVAEIMICCKLSGLTTPEKGAFAEYLTYEGQDVALYVHWFARRLSELPGSRRWVDIAVRSGPDGSGPPLDAAVRQLLATCHPQKLVRRKQLRASIHDAAHQGLIRRGQRIILRDDVAKAAPGGPS